MHARVVLEAGKVSIERCPQSMGGLIEGFHCICVVSADLSHIPCFHGATSGETNNQRVRGVLPVHVTSPSLSHNHDRDNVLLVAS